MFFSLKLKDIFKNKIFYIVIIVIFLLIATVLYINADKIILGERIENLDLDSVLHTNSYYAEYDMTIVSNKNVNTYFVKEWVKNEKFRFEHLDRMNSSIITIVNGGMVNIQNLNEKNKLTFNNLNADGNILCFATFQKIYNELINKNYSCNCKVETYEKEDVININISICDFKNINCAVYNNIYNENASSLLLELNKSSMLPTSIMLNDESKNMIKGIVYTKFEINSEIPDELFVIE